VDDYNQWIEPEGDVYREFWSSVNRLYLTYTRDIVLAQWNRTDPDPLLEGFQGDCNALGGVTILFEFEYYNGTCANILTTPPPPRVYEPLCVVPSCLEQDPSLEERNFFRSQKYYFFRPACTGGRIRGITAGIDPTDSGDWNACFNSADDYDFTTLVEPYTEYADSITTGGTSSTEIEQMLQELKNLCEREQTSGGIGGTYLELETTMNCTTREDDGITFRDPWCFVPCILDVLRDEEVIAYGETSLVFDLHPECAFLSAEIVDDSSRAHMVTLSAIPFATATITMFLVPYIV